MRVLLRLSEGTRVEPELFDEASRGRPVTLQRLQIGYVVDRSGACRPGASRVRHPRLRARPFSTEADGLELYRTPVAPPHSSSFSG